MALAVVYEDFTFIVPVEHHRRAGYHAKSLAHRRFQPNRHVGMSIIGARGVARWCAIGWEARVMARNVADRFILWVGGGVLTNFT
jgi:hypothetical protein